jgi:serine/threonine-protein kinase
MELAHGETLAALLRREGKVGPVEALKLVLPLVDGLRCAHERGIVHRDIKPENVFVARDALGRVQPKLLDFGIAKLEQQPSVSRLTQVGEVLGSPEFMSPEQARGLSDIDARTDVWSLCVMLYEMITGTLPFKITNYNALMQAILHEQPVPTVEYAAGDRELWLVIAKGLEKTRERRWSNMFELGEALAFWLYDHGVSEDVAGNSLKAVWLGGTLTGLSAETHAPLLTAARPLDPRGSPTIRLHFRRFRQRALRVLRPAVLATVGTLGLCGIALFSLRSATQRDDAAEHAAATGARPAAAHAASEAPPAAPTLATAAPLSADAPSAIPTVAASALRRAKPVTAPTGPPLKRQRQPSNGAKGKSIRDFGI